MDKDGQTDGDGGTSAMDGIDGNLAKEWDAAAAEGAEGGREAPDPRIAEVPKTVPSADRLVRVTVYRDSFGPDGLDEDSETFPYDEPQYVWDPTLEDQALEAVYRLSEQVLSVSYSRDEDRTDRARDAFEDMAGRLGLPESFPSSTAEFSSEISEEDDPEAFADCRETGLPVRIEVRLFTGRA